MLYDIIFPLLGGLGVFLYGIKLMSESLQEAAGHHLKKLISKMTKSRPMAVFSGVAITCMVQSSSITTVMVVGFVNAGLLKLSQAIMVIMGANIGTTITAWMVALLGFKFKILNFALPSIFLGMLFTFLSKKKLKFYGLMLIGFGFLFLGLNFMKSAIPDATKNPEAFQFLGNYIQNNFTTILIFLAIGILLTIIIQSSSATTTITIALTFSGFIPLEAAFGMILGENIGTTITANIAALAGNIHSKRAALAHTFFNLIGVIWALCLFYPLVDIVAFIVQTDPLQDSESTRFHISTFHSIFNLINTILLIGFISPIEKIVIKISHLFSKTHHKEAFQGSKLLKVPVASMGSNLELEQISSFTRLFINKALKNFINIEKLILKKYSTKVVTSILETETILNRYRDNVIKSLNTIQEEGVVGRTAKNIISVTEMIKQTEEIGDCFTRIARRSRLADNHKTDLSRNEKVIIEEQINLISDQIKLLRKSLKGKANKQIKLLSQKIDLKVQKKFHSLEIKTNKKNITKVSNWLSLMLALDLSRDLYLTNKSLNNIINVYLSI